MSRDVLAPIIYLNIILENGAGSVVFMLLKQESVLSFQDRAYYYTC